MNMNFDDAISAINDAKNTIKKGDLVAKNTAILLRNRLRASGVDHTTLCELKRELKNYNMHTREWTR